ncbi:MAG: sugar phosphate isomerase/epimerase [Hyphomonadaceae bacterium]
MFSRRTFLATSAGAMAVAACRPVEDPPVVGRKIDQIGIQTYTLRDSMQADMPATLAMIKRAGYDYVELNRRDFAEISPQTLIDRVKAAGLYAPSTHLSYDPVRTSTADMVATCKTLGCEYGIIPWMDESQRELEDWKRHARVFNEAGKMFADNGLRLAYHNHQFEFDDLGGGTTAMQVLLENTNPDFVDFQLDIFWAVLGGINLPELFKENPGRFKLSHIKDMKGDPASYRNNPDYADISKSIMVNVGEGNIDFASVFALNDTSGMEYFITEHDALQAPFEASIKTSQDAVRALRF